MKTTASIDAARLELLLTELRLPTFKLMWKKLAEQSDKEGWPAARFLAALAEHEVAERVCPSARHSRPSTSRPSRWSARRR
jgi:DNA replication protein DnaC